MQNDSILTSVKKMLGIAEEYTYFDDDIIMHINAALFTLYQLGVGETPYTISDESQVWSDFCHDINKLEAIRPYVYLKVRMAFDPPTATAAMEAAKNLVSEYEFRINVAVDPKEGSA